MSASKSIITDLNQGEKLNGQNYDIWSLKVKYLLEDQNILEPISEVMAQPERPATQEAQTAYTAWKEKDRVARITLLSSMSNDLLMRFERFRTSKALWDAVKLEFGGTSTTRLRQLTLKFDGYNKRQDHSMRQHLTTMSNMISQLRAAGHVLTDEQQVQVVIRSLPKSWEHMRVNLTHNDSIKKFEDVARHVELEEDRLMAEKGVEEAYLVSSDVQKKDQNANKRKKGADGSSGSGSGQPGSKKSKQNKKKKEKFDKSKLQEVWSLRS
jgi:hypothetical protein